MQTTDIYLRITDAFGAQSVTPHTVWDRDLFLSARVRDANKANEEVTKKGGIGLAKVETLTRDEYRAIIWPKK